MDILEIKYPEQSILKILNVLKFKDSEIKLVGTGGLKAQLYPADYDFLCKVNKKYHNSDIVYDEFMRILSDVVITDDLFFIEFKFQSKDGTKHKLFDVYEFTKKTFDKYYNKNTIDYLKFDGIATIKGEIKEVSCVYFFSSAPITQEKYREVLLKDQKHYYDEKKYYKSLKRMLMAEKNSEIPDRTFIKLITQFFNSEVGNLYKLKNMIDAVIIFIGKYKKPSDLKRVNNFLIDNGLKGVKLDDLEKLSDEYGKIIDREGLKFYQLYNIPVGKLPEYNTINKGGSAVVGNISDAVAVNSRNFLKKLGIGGKIYA